MNLSHIIGHNKFLKQSGIINMITSETNTELDQVYFLIGYWSNAYSSRVDREYFWSGGYIDRSSALRAGKRLQERGNPKTFIDYVRGRNKVIKGVKRFKHECTKVGLSPNLDNIEIHDY